MAQHCRPGTAGPAARRPRPAGAGCGSGCAGGDGVPLPFASAAVSALSDPAWQVRAGAATALSSVDPVQTVAALAGTLAEPNADVRKAAVLALLHHTSHEAVREALSGVLTDADADVRAYAARGVGVNDA
ncbi:HEAT repeat domain-containing protein [Streptomyces atroolivaceus]|uniref:HEAT repeat domain-containing protein n=1 Tax=Streptomyces atroolivaceus TaxID=66869 RepID=UPI0037966CF4